MTGKSQILSKISLGKLPNEEGGFYDAIYTDCLLLVVNHCRANTINRGKVRYIVRAKTNSAADSRAVDHA